jgi:hypothetical protein
MNTREREYTPRRGDFSGEKGVMVGRFCDPSYNDIQLEFPCGKRRWFRFEEVCAVLDSDCEAEGEQ